MLICKSSWVLPVNILFLFHEFKSLLFRGCRVTYVQFSCLHIVSVSFKLNLVCWFGLCFSWWGLCAGAWESWLTVYGWTCGCGLDVETSDWVMLWGLLNIIFLYLFLLGCQFLQRGIFLISRLENVSLASSFLEAEWRIELRVWHSLCKRPYNPPRFQYGTSALCSSLTPETLFSLLRCEKGTAWFCGIRSGIKKVDIH